MNLKRVILITLTLFLASGVFGTGFAQAGDAKLSVRTFQFKYKEADKAAAIIKSLMSADGSIQIQPSTNALVVTDRADNLKSISQALAQFDAPAQAFKLSIRLVSATRVDGAGKVSEDLRDIAPKLAMLRFNELESLGSTDVDGKEGDAGIVDLKSGYRADFKFGEFDPASDTIKISDFRLARLQGAQNDQLTQLLKASLNLKLGQTVILGASKVPQSQRALMLVVVARR